MGQGRPWHSKWQCQRLKCRRRHFERQWSRFLRQNLGHAVPSAPQKRGDGGASSGSVAALSEMARTLDDNAAAFCGK